MSVHAAVEQMLNVIKYFLSVYWCVVISHLVYSIRQYIC